MAAKNKAAKSKGSKPGKKAKAQVPQPGGFAGKMQREKAETKEIAGRHKNAGQKDHKGAR